ncbi:SDR family oxidoreductase [Alphaproteobacteria bacterium]|nr:SDR family oxidoreductase [Alphaproteobacteria bacterium]
MNVLITGNQGYIGPVLAEQLKKFYEEIKIIGFDTGFFSNFTTSYLIPPDRYIDQQFTGDLRDIDESLLDQIDAVIHLAAISNDPIGNEFEHVTHDINIDATVRLLEKARDACVGSFVFASSCSVYGKTGRKMRTENDQTNPLTAYAKSKIETEKAAFASDLGDMVFTSLRFATACGWSPRLRLDLVLNDFVASALTTNSINIFSDGLPFRPLIDVKDMAQALNWAIQRGACNGGNKLIVNAGSNKANYQVFELAQEVAKQIEGTDIAVLGENGNDNRSYQVDFSKYADLAPEFQPTVGIDQSIEMLTKGLSELHFSDTNFHNSNYMRLNSLKNMINAQHLSNDLRWLDS